MSSEPGDHHPERRRFDRKNFAVGTVVSTVLVALLGDGTMILFQARTPEEEGVNIGGAWLGILGGLLAAGLGAVFTARRARRRGGQPRTEGLAAGATGFALAFLGPELAISMVGDPIVGAATVVAILAGVSLGLLVGRVGRVGHHHRRGHRRA